MTTDHERALSFGRVAEDYDRLRTAPPDEAVAWLLPDNCDVALDVGAGTGLLTRVLLRHVEHVIAVEPDARMRAVLSARSPGVPALDGRAEAIPVPDASADAVFVSSAWHWMDPERASAEIARVLRPGGRFGVVGTTSDREVGWVREIDAFHESDARHADHLRRYQAILPPGNTAFANAETATFTFERLMRRQDLVDMFATYSSIITATPAERDAGLAGVRSMLRDRFPQRSEIAVPMRSWCWRADRTTVRAMSS